MASGAPALGSASLAPPPVIRLAHAVDAQAIADIYRPAVVDAATSFELDPPDGAEMVRRIAQTLQRTPWLVCEHAGTVLGYAYASAHRERAAYRWSVDVSAYVRGDVHRAGIASGLYASLLAVLVRQGYRNAYAGITLPNAASVALHTAVGFTPVGVYRAVGYKAGAWHDVAWYARALAPHVDSPPEPTLLPSLMTEDGTGFAAALAVGEARLRVRPC